MFSQRKEEEEEAELGRAKNGGLIIFLAASSVQAEMRWKESEHMDLMANIAATWLLRARSSSAYGAPCSLITYDD